MKKWIVVCLLPLLAACATSHKMAFDHATKKLDLGEKAIVLVSVKMTNSYKPSYQPVPNIVFWEKPMVRGAKDRLNYVIDAEAEKGGIYYVRMAVPAGKYILRGIGGNATRIFIIGNCFLPVHQDIELHAGEVIYLGRVAGTIRKREGEEFRAGSVIPLIDQAVTGFSGGTFDVLLEDQYKQDMNVFQEKFPVLKAVEVSRSVFLSFDRTRALAWWKKHY